MRTNFDFSPFRRSTVGFDHLFDMLEGTTRIDAADGYPPFDIARESEDSYHITLAVAGFHADDIEIVAQNNQLTISGKAPDERGDAHFLHRGIANRAFERRFQLADFVVVQRASLDNGLLRIALKREVPEAMKPRRIAIAGAPANDRIGVPNPDQAAA